jgi:hypothetical protein
MANPLRLSSELIAAAERTSVVYKRSVPKQIEYWAELGRAIERVVSMEDIIAVKEHIKKIVLEPIAVKTADPDTVFASLEKKRNNGTLANEVTSAALYYEASLKHPGLIDRVNAATGNRQAGHFRNGEFIKNAA